MKPDIMKPDNSANLPLTGWRLWLAHIPNAEKGILYRDPAVPACPECGSPNVRKEHLGLDVLISLPKPPPR
jgi:hypothetical protein